MDHRISKDMISSGMTPSGEKSQADLGRTQYGSAPSPSKLMDAYKSMYEHHQKDKDGNTIPHEGEELNEGKIPAGLQAYLDKKKGKKEDKKDDKEMKESVEEKVIKIKKDLGESADLFDIISTYFIEEGYDKKDVYAAMSSIDLSEEVQDLHEIVPAVMAGIKAVGGALVKKGIAGLAKAGAGKAGLKATASAFKNPTAGGIKNLAGMAGKGLAKTASKNPMTSYMVARDLMPKGGGGVQQPMMAKKTSSISASADLFDIVKGQLLDEGLSEEEIKDIMLTLTPDEILNEISAETALAASKARDVQAGKLKGPENTEKRAELRAKASQNYDRSVEKRKAGFVKNTATPQGPSRIPTGGM